MASWTDTARPAVEERFHELIILIRDTALAVYATPRRVNLTNEIIQIEFGQVDGSMPLMAEHFTIVHRPFVGSTTRGKGHSPILEQEHAAAGGRPR